MRYVFPVQHWILIFIQDDIEYLNSLEPREKLDHVRFLHLLLRLFLPLFFRLHCGGQLKRTSVSKSAERWTRTSNERLSTSPICVLSRRQEQDQQDLRSQATKKHQLKLARRPHQLPRRCLLELWACQVRLPRSIC